MGKRIIDVNGNAFQTAKEKALDNIKAEAYVAGDNARRSMRGWITTNGSPDQDLNPELPDIRSRSRDLVRNTPLGAAVVNRADTTVVGSGLKLQSRIKRKILGISDEDATRWERDVEARFDMWARSKDCDMARTSNFYALTGLSFRSMLEGGDCFALLPSLQRPRMDSKLKIALYEGDFVENPHAAMDTDKLSGGVETDSTGAPIKYYFRKNHPGSVYPSLDWKGVNAFGAKSGRRNVIHLFKQKRPGQRRGEPFLAPVVETLKQISRYTEAELMAAVVTSYFTVFVKTELGGADPALAGSISADQQVLDQTNAEDKTQLELGPGNVVDLGENESVDFADPKRPSAAFEPFFLAATKQVGAALGISYEVLIQHFSSSYSASRAALLEFWKFVQCYRSWMVQNWCDPIFEEWLTEEIMSGRIKAPGFLTNNLKRYAWLGSIWNGPPRGMIDPLKEIKASGEKIRLRLGTHEDEYVNANNDPDFESGMDRLSREEKLLKEKGLMPEETETETVPPTKTAQTQGATSGQ